MWIDVLSVRDFFADEVLIAAGILCVFQGGQAHSCGKRSAVRRQCISRVYPNKKGGGANQAFAPHGLPFRYERRFTVVAHYNNCLRRQNLAALCTAAGKNLAAVGSSHSLTETVDLGSVATAGLIGTLHEYTSCQKSIMLNSQ